MDTKNILNKNNFIFKKKFGQNFLTDDNVLNNIIKVANVKDNTLVIEIGVGAAALTRKLSKVAKNVLGYEIDSTLNKSLSEILKDNKNVEIIYDDFLKRNIQEDISKYNYDELIVVANLPYYITTPIITKFIEEQIDVSRIVVMVQNEVADRFSAVPKTKNYNSLTIFLNYYFDIKKAFFVSRNVFFPKPNVDSAVVMFESKKEKVKVTNEELFFKLVKDSFKQKRKNLKNNLSNYDLNKISQSLSKINKDLTYRAEALSIEDYAFLSNELDKQ